MNVKELPLQRTVLPVTLQPAVQRARSPSLNQMMQSFVWSRGDDDDFNGSLPAPVSTGTTFARGAARKARAMRRESLMASLLVSTAPQDNADEDLPPILSLGDVLLEQVMFAMDRDDAQSFRCTCKAVRAVTLTPGFAVLWRKTHEMDAKARAEFERLKFFLDQVEEEEVETEVSSHHSEHRWERILPPRRKSSSAAPHAASSSASAEPCKPAARPPLVPPRSVGEARTPAEIKHYFDTLPELETEPAAMFMKQ